MIKFATSRGLNNDGEFFHLLETDLELLISVSDVATGERDGNILTGELGLVDEGLGL